MGMLLRLAYERGWAGVGVEPSPSLAGLAREHFGLEVLNLFLGDVPASHNESYDVVALSDVFEHVSEPVEMLSDVARLLKPDGLLYVKVPNALFNIFKQRVSKIRGRVTQHGVWDSYEHVVHYTDSTLRRMLRKGGFRVLELHTAQPVQIPVWHHHVGHYFQYPSPVALDWRRLNRAGIIGD
jgi:2-polyprenyl-3-methyl-5-hydroxy-6-metoxy-1,4-benzoquinol methylase